MTKHTPLKLKRLKNGRQQRLGFLEKVRLRFAGRRDGKLGLPRLTDGIYTSPFINGEVRGYTEFSAHIWCVLQSELEDTYSSLSAAADKLTRDLARLREAEDALAQMPPADLSLRYAGEERLTETQVRERRSREQEKRLRKTMERLQTVREEVAAAQAELSYQTAAILETEQSARLVCAAVREHTRRRISFYWGCALRRHPDKERIPTVPSADQLENTADQAEVLYLAGHESLIAHAKALTGQTEKEAE